MGVFPSNPKVLRFMLFPAKRRGWYTAVCLDLGLVREGKDSFKLYQQINKLAMRYVNSIRANRLSERLLSQRLPKAYVERYERLREDHALQQKWQRIFDAQIWQQRIMEERLKMLNG